MIYKTKKLKILFIALFSIFISNLVIAQQPTEAQKKAMQNAMMYGKNKVDASTIPSKYDFSWKYTLAMKTSSGKEMNIDYFLEPNSSYYGANMNQRGSEMFMIMDTKNKLMVNSFNKSGKKMAMASKIPDNIGTSTNTKKYTYKKLPNKTFLGFSCKGLEATSSDSKIIIYYTDEAKVGFSEMFKSQQNNSLPAAIKDIFKPGQKALTMFLNYTDTKDKSKNMTMTCTSLKQQSHTFNKSDYQFM